MTKMELVVMIFHNRQRNILVVEGIRVANVALWIRNGMIIRGGQATVIRLIGM